MNLLWKSLVLAVVVATGIAAVVKMRSGKQPLAAPDPVELARYLKAIAPPDADDPIWRRQVSAMSDTATAAPMPTATKVHPDEVPPVRSVSATSAGAPSTPPEAIPSEPQAAGSSASAPKVDDSKPEMEAKSPQTDRALLLSDTVPSESNAESQAAGMVEQPIAAPAAPGAPLAVHRVGQGDSLYKMASKYYGNSKHWTLIRDANPALRDGVRGMRIGMELIIPALPQANP